MTWVGPPPAALRLFGNKVAARAHAERLGVRVGIGSGRAVRTAEEALAFISTRDMRWPLLLKATRGGGGRGIRLVGRPEELSAAFASASREAEQGFGSADLFVEEWLSPCHHIEVQLLSDQKGGCVHLFERDCSLQHRNQKVVEIAPSPSLHARLRARLVNDAMAIWRGGGGVGVGTVEFLVRAGSLTDPDAEYTFLEVNPRLQVEHTVTEVVTGIDIVQAQLLTAAGRGLAELGLASQDDVIARGVSLQLRLNGTGGGSVVTGWRPPSGPGIRVDSALFSGYRPSREYDPLLAKVICCAGEQWSLLHPGAAPIDPKLMLTAFRGVLARATAALDDLRCDGVMTNAAQLAAMLQLPDLLAGSAHTRTLHEKAEVLSEMAAEVEGRWKAARALEGASDTPTDDGTGAEVTRSPRSLALVGAPVSAPVTGSVVAVAASTEGVPVRAGEVLLTLSSMKMEFEVKSACAGMARVSVAVGDLVEEGELVAAVDELETDTSDSSMADACGTDATGSKQHGWEDVVSEIEERRRLALLQGGEAAVARHHARGRMTVRERLEALLDGSSLAEVGRVAGGPAQRHEDGTLGSFPPANFVLGTGKVEGRLVVACGEDFSIACGSPNVAGLRKSIYAETLALDLEVPLIRLHEGGGGSVKGAGGNSKQASPPPGSTVYETPRFMSVARCLATVPVVSAAMGAVAGLPVRTTPEDLLLTTHHLLLAGSILHSAYHMPHITGHHHS